MTDIIKYYSIQPFSVIDPITGSTGDFTVGGDLYTPSISVNGGELMTRIPNSQDFQLFGNQSSTGVIEFQGLSANTIDNSKFDIGIVRGWIVNNTTNPTQPVVQYIDYSGSTSDNPSGITLTYLATNPVTYIGITGETTADIVQSTSPFTEGNHRDTLVLGVIIHSNNTSINAINDLPALAIDPTGQYYDLIKSIGFFNVGVSGVEGNIYSPNDGNLNIDKSFGRIFAHSSNYVNDPKNPHVKDMASGTSITFRYRLQDSTEYSNTTTIDPDNYDNNGVLTAVPQNKFTVQRVTLFTSNITRLQYGQNIYDSLDDAEASLSSEDFLVESNIGENGLLRGFIITKQGTTSLGNSFSSRVISANHNGHANDTVVGNVHRTEILNHTSTGLREGGVVSVDSPTTFSISAGSGIIVDNYTNPNVPVLNEVVWDTITGVTATLLSGDVGTVITLDVSATPQQYTITSPPTQSDKRDEILIGGLSHTDKSTITSPFNTPIHIMSPVNQVEDLTTSIGPFSISGNLIEPISGTLELSKTLGSSFYYGGNFQSDNTNPSTVNTIALSGSSTPFNPIIYATGIEITGPSGYTIDTTNYDPDGLGVLSTLDNNKFTTHRIWHTPLTNLLVFQFGQFQYNSLNLAVDAFSTETLVSPPGLSEGGYLISVIITKKGETDLSNTSTTKFIQQGKFAGSGGGGSIADTLQSVYDNSTQPEITTDTTRTSVDFRVGSGADSDNVITFQNSTGGTTSWFNGLGESSTSSSFIGDSLYTTSNIVANSGITISYTMPSSGYTSGFYDYNIRGTSSFRAGTITSIWDGGTVDFIDSPTANIGDTSTITMFVDTTDSVASLKVSATTNNWIVKTNIRSI